MGVCNSSNDKKGDKNKVIEANQNKDGNKDKNKDNDKDKNKDKDKDKEKDKESKNEKKEETEDNAQPSIMEIKIKFVEKGEEVFSSTFHTLDQIKVMFNEISEKVNKYSQYDLLTPQNESLKAHIDEKIFKIFKNKSEEEITLFYLGLDIPVDIRKEYETSTTVISTPLLDLGSDFGLVLYNKCNQTVTHAFIDSPHLSVFSHISAFCNGNNLLFISGGESQNPNEYIADFCSIDLFNNDRVEKLPELTEARGWHSMIFIPSKYVFIVSGTTKSVEMFDTEKKMLTVDSELNEARRECTLCCVNNSILYVFCGFVENESHLNTIEQCNLRQARREWTYVNYSTSDNVLFEQCYYIASYFSDSSIILFSSNENSNSQNGNILFDFEDENNPVIEKYETNININDICPEKFFHPMSDKTSMLFPLATSMVKVYKIDENMQINVVEYPEIMKQIFE